MFSVQALGWLCPWKQSPSSGKEDFFSESCLMTFSISSQLWFMITNSMWSALFYMFSDSNWPYFESWNSVPFCPSALALLTRSKGVQPETDTFSSCFLHMSGYLQRLMGRTITSHSIWRYQPMLTSALANSLCNSKY